MLLESVTHVGLYFQMWIKTQDAVARGTGDVVG